MYGTPPHTWLELDTERFGFDVAVAYLAFEARKDQGKGKGAPAVKDEGLSEEEKTRKMLELFGGVQG